MSSCFFSSAQHVLSFEGLSLHIVWIEWSTVIFLIFSQIGFFHFQKIQNCFVVSSTSMSAFFLALFLHWEQIEWSQRNFSEILKNWSLSPNELSGAFLFLAYLGLVSPFGADSWAVSESKYHVFAPRNTPRFSK